jgi:hypothetical protein
MKDVYARVGVSCLLAIIGLAYAIHFWMAATGQT